MCGLLAIAKAGPVGADAALLISDRALAAAMARLRRRGPDDEGVWRSAPSVRGRIVLAHTRLAIQDLSAAGRQPMLDNADSTRVAIAFNGEIYNAPALRRELERTGVTFRSATDTEVLLRGYTAWGMAGLLERIRGMYALVIADLRGDGEDGERGIAPVIHAAVDPAGMKPLAWTFAPGSGNDGSGARLALASDCDALLAALRDEPGGSAPRLDGAALSHILSIGYCPAPLTVWRGIRKLAPGERLSWRMGDAAAPSVTRHWQPPEEIDATRSGDEQEAMESLLRRVIDEHLLADVPVGLFLSAGLDSSAIALALAQAGRADDVTAYTLAPVGIDPAMDESPVAAALAGAMMMRHRIEPFHPADLHRTLLDTAAAFDEPQGFTALLTAVSISQRARAGRGPRVVLAGDGGDEAFGGYAWHRGGAHPLGLAGFDPAVASRAGAAAEHARLAGTIAAPEADPAARVAAARALADQSFTHRYLCRVFPGFHPAESRALLGALEPTYDTDVFAAWLAVEDRPRLPHPRRAQRLDVLGFCAGSILPKIDRAAMSVALEMRAPFLDRRVLDWALARPPESAEMESAVGGKPPLRRFLERGATAGLVPREVLTRPKQGFSLRQAGERPFATLAESVLPGSRLLRDGIVRKDYAAFLPASAEAREVRLFTLTMMAAWYEQRRSA